MRDIPFRDLESSGSVTKVEKIVGVCFLNYRGPSKKGVPNRTYLLQILSYSSYFSFIQGFPNPAPLSLNFPWNIWALLTIIIFSFSYLSKTWTKNFGCVQHRNCAWWHFSTSEFFLVWLSTESSINPLESGSVLFSNIASYFYPNKCFTQSGLIYSLVLVCVCLCVCVFVYISSPIQDY